MDTTDEAGAATPIPPSDSEAGDASDAVQARTPTFSPLQDGEPSGGTSIDRFYAVNVTVWAELGRVSMSLGELLKLGAGSVLKLDRPVSAPVDLMAQGVRVARGEVVVVDDYFAVRIKEIESTRKSGT